jgi:hypothetical protein
MNHRRRRAALSAALAAVGLVPAAVEAAPIGSNLVVNGDFESVDPTSTGNYSGPKIRVWSGLAAFAYSHDGSMSGAAVVPDYADGADPPGAGHWYFSANNDGNGNAGPDIRNPGDFYQDIDVSGGPSGALINSGAGRYNLSAYMSSYLNDNDFGNVQVEFFNAGGGSLGTAMISDGDPGPDNVWNLSSLAGAVPLGTSRVRVSVYGTAVNAGPDAYIDNVTFQVVPEPSALCVLGGAFALTGLRRKRRRDGP